MNALHYVRWRAWFVALCTLIVLICLGLLAARGALLLAHRPAELGLNHPDIAAAFWLGLRFDLKHLSVLLGPWLLLSLLFYRTPAGAWRFFSALFWLYSAWLLLLVNLFSVVNHYYFAFYQSPINALFFGLQEDDTQAVLTTVWADFPVIGLVLLILGLSCSQWWLARKVQRQLLPPPSPSSTSTSSSTPTPSKLRFALYALTAVVVFTGLGRGSLGTFPLRTQHMNVSTNSFINQLIPSGAHALHLAHKERQRDHIGNDPLVLVHRAGFSSWQEAARVCGLPTLTASNGQDKNGQQLPIRLASTQQKQGPSSPSSNASEAKPVSKTATTDSSLLFAPTPMLPAATAQPPHVVVALMESWGRHLLDYDDPETNDMLGRLRPWLSEKGDYFPRAVSAQNGTHASLEALLLDTPITPLMQSSHGYQQYDSSRLLPYKEQGYKTIFLTAGSAGWRQLDPTLLRQGFDEIYDEIAIKERYPEAENHTWGVDDEWMFLYAQDLLKEAEDKGEKVVLFMLSVTNHPPYRVPASYQPAPLSTEPIRTVMAADAQLGQAILQTYEYANDALGGFLDGLEQSGLLAKTLVAATGDHTNRSIFVYPDSTQLHYKYGVPLWFYIPPAYQGPEHAAIDRQQWSSHQDLFPTLWAHSLSAQPVPLNGGRNLFATTADQLDGIENPDNQHNRAFGTPMALSFISEAGGRGFSISHDGAVVNAFDPTYLEWDSNHSLQPTQTPSAALQAQAQRTKACLALSDWRIRQQARQKP